MLTVAKRLAKCPVCGALQETQNTHKMLEDNLDRLEILHDIRKPPSAAEHRDAKVRPVVKEQDSESSEESGEREEEAKSSTNPPEVPAKPHSSKSTSCCALQ